MTHILFCSKSLPCWPCINRNRLIYALSKLPPPTPEMTKMVPYMLYLVLAVF